MNRAHVKSSQVAKSRQMKAWECMGVEPGVVQSSVAVVAVVAAGFHFIQEREERIYINIDIDIDYL